MATQSNKSVKGLKPRKRFSSVRMCI